MRRAPGVLMRWAPGVLLRQAACARHASSMTADSCPQLLLCAFGPHKTGAVAKISSIVFQSGGSIAQTKKIIVDDHFAMLTSVHLPDDAKRTPAQLSALLQSAATTETLGFPVTVKQLAGGGSTQMPQTRRLKLELPQRPGIVLGITEILKDHGCALSAIDADTMAKPDGEIWFQIECLVDVPNGVDAAWVESDLQFWLAQEARASLIFDKWLRPNTTTDMH